MARPSSPNQPLGLSFRVFLMQREQDFLFLGAGLVEERGVAALGAHAQVHEQGGVAAVVEDHVGHAAVAPLEQAQRVVPVVLQALALDGEHRRAAGGDGGRGVVLRRVDVARDPAHVGAERRQRLDQHGRLDGHVQRAGDAGALQRLRLAELLAGGHQARHLGLGDGDFLAAPVGQADVLHYIVVASRHERHPAVIIGFSLARRLRPHSLGCCRNRAESHCGLSYRQARPGAIKI